MTAKHLADGCLKASILCWRKIHRAGSDSPREARQLLLHASGPTGVEAEMYPQQAWVCTLCVCQGYGRQREHSVLAEQEGALGVRVCAYTRWRSCPAAELRHWLCSVAVLVPPVAGTWTYELPGLTGNNPRALICRDTQVFASSHS